ncbi:hypothetical protein M2146_001039 [Lachnospiraceae bacterium PF1-22]
MEKVIETMDKIVMIPIAVDVNPMLLLLAICVVMIFLYNVVVHLLSKKGSKKLNKVTSSQAQERKENYGEEK